MIAPDQLAERAVRLFEFLAEVQRIKDRPESNLDRYDEVTWLGRFPEHDSITVPGLAGAGADEVVATLDRVPEPEPPTPPLALKGVLTGRIDEPRQAAVLDPAALTALDEDEQERLQQSYDNWIDTWYDWAEQEELDRPARKLYQQLFSTRLKATGNTEELELVLGLGCLTWNAPGGATVRRHLLTTAASVEFDDLTGRLSIVLERTAGALRLETDMVDPGLVADTERVRGIRADAADEDVHPLDRDHVGDIAKRFVHVLDPRGGYEDADTPYAPGPNAFVTYAPALVLRRRSRRGLIEIYQRITAQLRESGTVPAGLRHLFDPDHDPVSPEAPREGALVQIEDEPFLPLPVNDVQLGILKRVDTHLQTLVQGPPGTGKTHTAAALLSHLLAQGKRVLVTAQTDRALQEVRNKLPEEIRELAVAVVGRGREEMAALQKAATHIGTRVTDYDPVENRRTIDRCLAAIDRLKRERAELNSRLISLRMAEVEEHDRFGYRGTMARIVVAHQEQEARYAWIAGLVGEPGVSPPLSDREITTWLGLLRHAELNADRDEARLRLVDPALLTEPETFAEHVRTEAALAGRLDHYASFAEHPARAGIAELSPQERTGLRERVGRLGADIEQFRLRRESWIADALADVLQSRHEIWRGRYAQLRTLADHVVPLAERLGARVRVEAAGERAPLVELANAVRGHLANGGRIKTRADGSVHLTAFAPGILKQARRLFEGVRVNGLPPSNEQQLVAFLLWAEAWESLDALDKLWPQYTVIPDEDTVHERVQWHLAEIGQLQRLLAFGDVLVDAKATFQRLNVKQPDWTDPSSVDTWTQVADSVDAAERLAAARRPLEALERLAADQTDLDGAAPVTRALHRAVLGRDIEAYAAAHARTVRLHAAADLLAKRDALGRRLGRAAPSLRAAVEADPDAAWTAGLTEFTAAWNWAAVGGWIRGWEQLDGNALRAKADLVDEQIREQVERLAATRAWGYAASPQRVDGRTRQALMQYAQLVRRHGKGTGRYAAGRQQQIREALADCRSAVPVWIMPIHRIAEQLRVAPNMFDVVVVDEASQAGMEAVFLQYLAPRIVIIGDEKQVSPLSVGVEEQDLIDLAPQYLPEMKDRKLWTDPRRSLFDDANMRFRERLTLREHRRCVPEIIGFSNQIAYEPEGVALIPVRQYGADRLEPLMPVKVADGYTRGITAKVNPPEVEAIVEQIAKCASDPRYDGKTFGVISLTGAAQANAIEKALLDRIEPEEWAARELRCGQAPDFQGAERDVMFLSMVVTVEPDVRYMSLTSETHLQRFNVAASRAKDQMWVFHSMDLSELHNKDDLRRRLLEYCYAGKRRAVARQGHPAAAVPEDLQVDPFDSLFEQRVFNRLSERGYLVEPQVEVNGYRIDLVVVGANARLAVECDGDHWHEGVEAYERDLRRQRDLERCGWRFFRIRESRFYADRAAVLDELVEKLRELDIHPAGWTSELLDVPEPRAVPAPYPDSELVPAPVAEVLEEAGVEEADAYGSAAEDTGRVEPVPDRLQALALEPFQEYKGRFPPLDGQQPPRDLIKGLLAVVEAEGPMLGAHLMRSYRAATGASRTGRLIAESLKKAIKSAVRRGDLIQSDPLDRYALELATFRLPEQPAVRVRAHGPRDIEDIPPAELATVMAACARECGWSDPDRNLYRAVLAAYGWTRRTTNTMACLRRVYQLARQIGAARER